MNYFFTKKHAGFNQTWLLLSVNESIIGHLRDMDYYFQDREGDWWYIQHTFCHTWAAVEREEAEWVESLDEVQETLEVVRL